MLILEKIYFKERPHYQKSSRKFTILQKMKEKIHIKILLILLLLQAQKVWAQQPVQLQGKKNSGSALPASLNQKRIPLPSLLNQSPLPADYYSRHTGFFCQKEKMLENKTKIPLRFRLGSLAYTRKMEGYTY